MESIPVVEVEVEVGGDKVCNRIKRRTLTCEKPKHTT
jgi:hypothetical protein